MTNDTRYGICDCGKWGIAPANFNESKHFLKCECGKLMYLDPHNPHDVGYGNKSMIPISVVNQK